MMRARRTPIVDEYVEDGRAVVYSNDGVVIVLSELATCAWSVLSEEWTSLQEVTDALVRTFGPPADDGDALEETRAALRTLSEHGLVDLGDDD